METKTVHELRLVFRSLVSDELVRDFFASLGQLAGELIVAKGWHGEIEGAEESSELIAMFREKCDSMLSLVNMILEEGARAVWEWNWASHVFSIYEMLSDLDDALHGRITLRRDSSVRYVTTFWELFRHIMRAVANGSDRVVIDGYYVSREEA